MNNVAENVKMTAISWLPDLQGERKPGQV